MAVTYSNKWIARDLDGKEVEFSTEQEATIYEEKIWRDQELISTDYISQISDHVELLSYQTYRQLLRDYPSTDNFPTTRPIFEVIEPIEPTPREWRNKELLKSDHIVPITDHPQHGGYITYRQELRDWPSLDTFPSASSRPTL